MRHVLVLLALLYSTKAYADTPPCYLAEKLLPALTVNSFLPVVEMEIEHHPGMILVNPEGEWIALVLMDEKTVCEMAHGKAFHLVKWRKA